jgi:type II secretory pathway predicted ATPase ExeA
VSWIRLGLALAGRALRSPSTFRALVVTAWRFRRRRWAARFPFLPLPAVDYLRWRMHTAYGDPNAVPSADEVVRYARWAVRAG